MNGEIFSNRRLHTFNSVNLREQDSISTSTIQPPPDTPEFAKKRKEKKGKSKEKSKLN